MSAERRGIRGFVITPTYRIVGGRPEVHLYGRLENAEPCLILDDRAEPHFFVRASVADIVRLVESKESA